MPSADAGCGRWQRGVVRFGAGLVALSLVGCATAPAPSPPPQPPTVRPDVVVQAPAPVPKRLPRVGLALGGGAARGFAHVGVIQVLEQNGIRPDLVVGTSAGALVGALYASGKDAAELLRAAESMDEAALTDWTLPFGQRGVLRGQAVARYVSAQVQGRPIEALPLPLGVVATDLATGEGILFRRGDTATAVRASSAVPGVFQPVEIAGREYVDGGLVAPVPVQYARQMGAELVIAVDISSAPQGQSTTDVLRVMLQTFAIMGQTINRHELKGAQVVVRPSLTGVGGAAFSERQRAIAAGRAAMQEALPRLRQQLDSWRPPTPP